MHIAYRRWDQAVTVVKQNQKMKRRLQNENMESRYCVNGDFLDISRIFLILSQLLEWKPAYAMMAWYHYLNRAWC